MIDWWISLFRSFTQMGTVRRLFRNILPKRFMGQTSANAYETLTEEKEVIPIAKSGELHRNLKERHMIMIALGGTIGTGLFLASGQALNSAGPGGALVSYLAISVMVYFVMTSLGKLSIFSRLEIGMTRSFVLAELATQFPISGSFNTFGSRFVDEAFGFALAYNYYFSWVTTVAAELVAAGIIVQLWLPHFPTVVWSALGMAVMFLLNAFTVKGYGEAEYWFAMTKVVTVLIFLLVGLLVDVGAIGKEKYARGFENWKRGDAPFVGGVAGVITTSIISGFAFQVSILFLERRES